MSTPVSNVRPEPDKVLTDITAIPNECRFAIAQDPTGATFALYQDDSGR